MKDIKWQLLAASIVIAAVVTVVTIMAIAYHAKYRQDSQVRFIEQTPQSPSTIHFTATLTSPDRQITLPVECIQSLYGSDGPECYAVFPNNARMEIQSVTLPDKNGQRYADVYWSADSRFAVNCVMDDDVCVAHQIWDAFEGTQLKFWLPGLAIVWWSPTGHKLGYVRDIMAVSMDWGIVDVQTGEVSLPDKCPEWLSEYVEDGTGRAGQADFLCSKVTQGQ